MILLRLCRYGVPLDSLGATGFGYSGMPGALDGSTSAALHGKADIHQLRFCFNIRVFCDLP